jgi:hypothetical protein
LFCWAFKPHSFFMQNRVLSPVRAYEGARYSALSSQREAPLCENCSHGLCPGCRCGRRSPRGWARETAGQDNPSRADAALDRELLAHVAEWPKTAGPAHGAGADPWRHSPRFGLSGQGQAGTGALPPTAAASFR